ncbi:MAG: trypsin-like peptidase domain-containing protein [Lachnospiraceae bacterium]|nr:trypsin-like peptidase domain-containing protein [Lachnospiraceae bacterium]
MKTFLKTLICAVAVGLAAALVLLGVRFVKYKKTEAAVKQAVIKQQEVWEKVTYARETDDNDTEKDTAYNVTGAAKCAMPSLVSVGVTSVTYSYDFFGRKYPYESKGNASGIIAAQNYGEILIVTNNHVVDGASEVEVTFIDGATAAAEVKAAEESEDLAVIAVKLSDISADTLSAIRIATFGDSDLLVPGDMVIAVGNALGYGQSVTVGYVSALNREVEMSDDYTLTLIQTDVAINPGNSGGALLNARGEVVGINNAKIASETVEGICYAIPSSTAIPIIEVLMTRKTLPTNEQAYLGFTGQIVTAENSKFYNLPRGIYVKEVRSGSPAETAGIKVGDVIVAINGKTVNSQEGYEKIMSYTPGGSEGTVTVKRLTEGKYEEETFNVTFGYKAE